MRPELTEKINPDEFKNYYWLKEELSEFCKKTGLPVKGSKDQLAETIFQYLKTGEVKSSFSDPSPKRRNDRSDNPISLEGRIPEGYRNDERHRAFFKEQIGDHFKFNVPFMNWMKTNPGKSYREAVAEWIRIRNKEATDKKEGVKREISSQFQYNRYTRDFFESNPGRKREEAVICWKYKKSLPGHNRYEDSDLKALAEKEEKRD